MAVNAGTVYYTVDADTQKALKSASEMNKSLDNTKRKMSGLDTQVTKTSRAVNSGLSSVGRSAGQAGIQVQQFIGQIQGGQSAMLALSQQSADLGFVLGAPLLGAVVGIGASIAGMLLPNLFKTTDALEDVEAATERVRAAITLSSEGITGYSDQMKVLAEVSDQLARIKLANLIADQSHAMSVAASGVNDTISEFNGLNYQMDLFGNKSDEAYNAFILLSQAAKSFEADPGGSIGELEVALDAATKAGINNTEAGRGLVSTITDLIAQYKLGELTISQLREQLDKTTVSFGNNAESADKWAKNAERLTVRTESLRSKQLELEKALTLKKAAEEGADQATINSLSSSYDKIIANQQEVEAEKALSKAKRERAQAERDALKAQKEAMVQDQMSADIMIKLKEQSDKNNQLLGQVDPVEGENQRFQAELNSLKTLNDAKLLEDQRYLTLKAQAETQHEENMQALREENFKKQSRSHELLIDTLNQLQSAGTSAISGLLSGTMSTTEAMQSLANAVLNEAVGALVEMGVQAVKNQIIGETAATASTATATAAGAAIASAYTPAANAAAIATQGGAVASATSAMASGIPTMTALLAGGRQYGGSTQAGSMYRVNEDGRPEVFNSANGQQYMLANTRGEVVSNSDASSGGSNTINVIINSDGSVTSDSGSLMQQYGKEIANFVEAKFKQLQAQSMRQGGSLWNYKNG